MSAAATETGKHAELRRARLSFCASSDLYLRKPMFSYPSQPDGNQGGLGWWKTCEDELTVRAIMPRSSVGVRRSPGDFTQRADSWEMGNIFVRHWETNAFKPPVESQSSQCEEDISRHWSREESQKFVIRPNKTCWNNSFSDCEQTLDDEARSASACCFSRMTQYVARLSAPKHLSLESCWGPLGTGCPRGSCGSVGGAAAEGPGAGCDSGTRPSSAASVGPGDPSSSAPPWPAARCSPAGSRHPPGGGEERRRGRRMKKKK